MKKVAPAAPLSSSAEWPGASTGRPSASASLTGRPQPSPWLALTAKRQCRVSACSTASSTSGRIITFAASSGEAASSAMAPSERQPGRPTQTSSGQAPPSRRARVSQAWKSSRWFFRPSIVPVQRT
ncbi:hypothetical protein ROTAS13_04789 [Roseomonas sp. TAS13]|nr:hypothetical protein ROTAS13_04789 [Roseomonas sp. TAS13]